MTRLLASAIVVSLAVALGRSSAKPVFDVASIRPEQPGVTQAQTAPIEVLVIDDVRPPTEN
jgi:hypothetical protein